jgi:hypothetical protein
VVAGHPYAIYHHNTSERKFHLRISLRNLNISSCYELEGSEELSVTGMGSLHNYENLFELSVEARMLLGPECFHEGGT